MSKTKNRRKSSEARCCAVEMIRDFLDHLLWELRTGQFEATNGNTLNPELAEMLGKYMKKRQTVGLLFATEFEAISPESVRQWRDTRARQQRGRVRCLEALSQVFREALACANRPKVFMIRRFDADRFDAEIAEMEAEIKLLDGTSG
jgi:hypothetical protein